MKVTDLTRIEPRFWEISKDYISWESGLRFSEIVVEALCDFRHKAIE